MTTRRQAITVAEVVMVIVVRRQGFQVQIGEGLHARVRREKPLVLLDGALTLGHIAGEEDDQRMELRAGQAAHPVVGVVGARVAEDRGPGGHALAKLLGEGRQRGLIHAQRAQAIPGQGDGQPARVQVRRTPN